MHTYTSNSSGFKKMFLIYAVGTLVALYLVIRCIFGFFDGINFISNKCQSSVENGILTEALNRGGIYNFGNAKYLNSLDEKDDYRENHFFFVSEIPGVGPALVLVQTDKYTTATSPIYFYDVKPFKSYGTIEGVDEMDKKANGCGLLEYAESSRKEEVKSFSKSFAELKAKYGT